MSDYGFDILNELGSCLFIQKPGGVLTQAPPGIDSLEVRIQRFLRTRDNREGHIYLGVPHRLDRPVSGVMVFATTKRATRQISEQFQGRLVQKTYWAVVEGDVQSDAGTWTDYVRKIPGAARSEVVDRAHEKSQIATLHYQVRGRSATNRSAVCTWLEIQLETGRTHQIRVQAGSRGHAVLGDELYGSQITFGPQTNDERERWIALHGRSLQVSHPQTRKKISVTAPLPAPWRSLEFEQSEWSM